MPNAWDSEETARSWQQVIDDALALPDALMIAAARKKPSNWVEHDEFTTHAALRLQHWANLQVRAICQLLRTGDTSPPAYGLIRGVIEVWAHLHWIYNGDKMRFPGISGHLTSRPLGRLEGCPIWELQGGSSRWSSRQRPLIA